jgi:hypothetical protein
MTNDKDTSVKAFGTEQEIEKEIKETEKNDALLKKRYETEKNQRFYPINGKELASVNTVLDIISG